MAAVYFYLKTPEKATGKSLIFLQCKYNRKRLVFSFKQTVHPSNWNPTKQRIKSNRATTSDGQHSLNDLLDNLERECLKSYNNHVKGGVPNPEVIKKDLQRFMNQNEGKTGPTLFDLIDRFTSGEIKNNGKEKTKGTLAIYRQTAGHLKTFATKEKFRVDFDTIGLDFYNKFIDYLKAKGLNQNSIGKHIKDVKTFMSEAVDRNLTTNIEFKKKKFSVTKQAVDSVYLTEREITRIYEFDLAQDRRLDQVRDLFIFGCFVGLRFSDYSTIKPENIVQIEGDYYIKTITQKTNELAIIPCNPVVLDIFKKYEVNENKLPRAISNQKFNNFVKEVCKKVGLTEKGRLSTDPGKELWQCISSHTARRSFATNLYLEGYPVHDIMKITAHKTETAFLKYLKTTKLDTALRLSKHIKKNWGEKLLRVAS